MFAFRHPKHSLPDQFRRQNFRRPKLLPDSLSVMAGNRLVSGSSVLVIETMAWRDVEFHSDFECSLSKSLVRVRIADRDELAADGPHRRRPASPLATGDRPEKPTELRGEYRGINHSRLPGRLHGTPLPLHPLRVPRPTKSARSLPLTGNTHAAIPTTIRSFRGEYGTFLQKIHLDPYIRYNR